MNTCNSGLWNSLASCCSRFASMITVPVPLPCLNPCKALCKIKVLHGRMVTIYLKTFQMTSTNPMPLYHPPHFGISTIVFHDIASEVYPSRNATCVILANLSHLSVSGSFSLISSHSHVFSCSAFIPDGPPACPTRSFRTAAAIYFSSGGPSVILTSCTSIGFGSPSGGRRL